MDVVTMVIMVGLVNVMLAIALLLQSRFNRQFGGVRWWAAGQTLIAAGLILSAFRGVSLTGKIVVPVGRPRQSPASPCSTWASCASSTAQPGGNPWSGY